MDLTEYQEFAKRTAIYPEDLKVIYPAIGMANECGEALGKIKKTIRDKNRNFNINKDEIVSELGDVLWYMSAIATDLNVDLSEIAEKNVEKILRRQEAGTIRGDGDNR
jgi:NTP pyrophosphatase (non-canonical NTP hydrolase)